MSKCEDHFERKSCRDSVVEHEGKVSVAVSSARGLGSGFAAGWGTDVSRVEGRGGCSKWSGSSRSVSVGAVGTVGDVGFSGGQVGAWLKKSDARGRGGIILVFSGCRVDG